MLLGRRDERLALDRLLAQARRGESGVLALVGEPGIGKTALLDHAAQQAHDMRVLRARGIESEAEIPFAGLAELLRPALSALDRIPAPQASALAGALALAPARAGDRFAIGAATLSLLSATAEERPLLLLVDDAHWLDASSAQALLFAARRLVADPVALVLSAREGEPSLLDGADLRVLRLAGLDGADAATLLAKSGLGADVAARLIQTTGGNPLALLELAADGTRLAATPPTAPVPISTSIARAFLRRFGGLPEPTRRVLVLAATSDRGDLAVLTRAAAVVGCDVHDLVAAETAGLVTLPPGAVAFRHPLARSAVYAEAPAAERRAAHAALAAALPDHDIDRRAWHLAAAAVGTDDRAAAALEQAGARARGRSAYAVAASAFERAAGLSADDDRRVRLLVEAADAAWLAGDMQRALTRLDDAGPGAEDAMLAARVDHLRGQVAMRIGPVMDGYPLAVRAAERIAATDPDAAVEMLAEAVRACFYAGDTPAMVAAATRATELAEPRGRGAGALPRRDRAGHGARRRRPGRGRRDLGAGARWRSSTPSATSPSCCRGASSPRCGCARPTRAAGRSPARSSRPARRRPSACCRRCCTCSRATRRRPIAGRPRRPATTSRSASPARRASAWSSARRSPGSPGSRPARGARRTAARTRRRRWRCATSSASGSTAPGRCRRSATSSSGWATSPLAAERHEALVAALQQRGIADVDLSPGPELVDAYVRLGRAGDAELAAAEYAARAEAKGQPWALARAARCRGLVAERDDMERCFTRALALHERTPDVFETARTRLAFGARLRRARLRVRAREELGAALATFEQLGARSWADQAGAELEATGATARRRDASTVDDLTPQELQIARLLAEGRTTRETAAAIFVSPKTVEYHLRHVYDKLGIRSRQELAAALDAR